MALPAYPPRIQGALDAVCALARHERYRAAFVFGSVARGEATARSDLDVKVIVDRDNPCAEINHPVIGAVKLDLTFVALAQLRRDTEREISGGRRVPMVAESEILFDKDGGLTALRAEAATVSPPRAGETDFHHLRFSLRHADAKVTNALKDDPATALLGLHLGLADLFYVERQLAGSWDVSSKRLLPQLRRRDPDLALLIEEFVATAGLVEKYALWQALVARIAAPLGDWRATESVCDCATCRVDLAALHGGATPEG